MIFTSAEIEAVKLSYEYLYDEYKRFRRMRKEPELKAMRISWIVSRLKNMQKAIHKMIEHSNTEYYAVSFQEVKENE